MKFAQVGEIGWQVVQSAALVISNFHYGLPGDQINRGMTYV